MKLYDWIDSQNLDIRMSRTYTTKLPKWVVDIPDVEIKSGSVLESVMSSGQTPDEALMDLAKRLSNKKIVLNAGQPSRRELNTPLILFDEYN